MNQPSASAPQTVRVMQSFTLALIVAGYPLVAAMSELFGFSSTPVSIGARALTGALCLALFIVAPTTQRSKLGLWLMVCGVGFWTLYMMRTVYDTVFRPFYLLYDPSSYWIWAVGGSIVPMIALARPAYFAWHSASHFRWCVVVAIMACVFALPSLSTSVSTDYGSYSTGRAGLVALNPISLGHLGVQVVLMCIWALFLNVRESSALSKVAYLAGIALGIFITLSANSRGPLVSLVGAVIFALAASNVRRKYWLVGLSLVAVAAFVPTIAIVDRIAGTDIYDRMLGQSQINEESTQGRFSLYSSAIDLIENSPLTGAGLEDPAFNGYPHNLVIESFMATGLFGGLLFAAFLTLLLLAAAHVFRRQPGYGWLALLTVQQVIGIQFSGSIAQSTIFWGLAGAMASIVALSLRSRHAAGQRRPALARPVSLRA